MIFLPSWIPSQAATCTSGSTIPMCGSVQIIDTVYRDDGTTLGRLHTYDLVLTNGAAYWTERQPRRTP